MKKLSKKFVQLSVVGTLLVAGGLFVAPQVQNLAAQASEPTKLVAFDQQANALGETINDVRESKTVTKTLAKAQETATKKQKEAQQKASQKLPKPKSKYKTLQQNKRQMIIKMLQLRKQMK